MYLNDEWFKLFAQYLSIALQMLNPKIVSKNQKFNDKNKNINTIREYVLDYLAYINKLVYQLTFNINEFSETLEKIVYLDSKIKNYIHISNKYDNIIKFINELTNDSIWIVAQYSKKDICQDEKITLIIKENLNKIGELTEKYIDDNKNLLDKEITDKDKLVICERIYKDFVSIYNHEFIKRTQEMKKHFINNPMIITYILQYH